MDRSVERTDEAISWLRDEAPDDRPWTLYLSYQPPHFPLTAPEEYWEQYPPEEMDLPFDYPAATDHPIVADLHEHFRGTDLDDETLRRLRTGYYALVTAIDEQIGRVLDALAETGQDEETIVIYTSDHGEMLGDRGLWSKKRPYQPSVGIPLVAAGPGIDAADPCDAPVSLLDLHRTVCDYAGLSTDAEGASLRPLLDRRTAGPATDRDCVHAALDDWQLAFDGRYKLIERHGDGDGDRPARTLYEVAGGEDHERPIDAHRSVVVGPGPRLVDSVVTDARPDSRPGGSLARRG